MAEATPALFEGLLGQAPATTLLLAALQQQRLAPAYLFAGDVMNIPIAGGNVGSGGNAHAANEYYVIEGAGKTYGYAGTEKSIVTALYNYAGKNKPAQ